MERLERKGSFGCKLIAWIMVFVPNTALCLAGLVISLQYQYDTCVTDTNYWNVFLDYWLLFVSLFQFSLIFMALPFVCYHFKNENIFPRFLLTFNMIMTVCIGFGIFLAVKSDLKDCKHDSLWAMSIVFMILIGIWIIVQGVHTLIKTVTCLCIEAEPEYEDLWRKWKTSPTEDSPLIVTSSSSITSVNLSDEELYIDAPQ
jgi:hypothetical protein